MVVEVFVSAVVAFGVAATTHNLAARRDRENKRREQRIAYLVGAYRALSKGNNHPRLYEVAADVQQAVADIQLFGSLEQAALARAFAHGLGREQSADLSPLLASLRSSLRSELGLTEITGPIAWVRIERTMEAEDAR